MVNEALMQKISAARRPRRRAEPMHVVEISVPDNRPGYRDAKLFDMLGGFRDHWHVIEGKGGPGSQYSLKHRLYAFLHELYQSRD